MQYKWNPRKPSKRQHICLDSGMSLCKVENGSRAKMVVSDIRNPDRQVCLVCLQLQKDPKRKVKHRTKPTVRDIVMDMIREGYIEPGPKFGETDWREPSLAKLMGEQV